MNKKLIIYGNGSFSEYVGYVFKHDTDYEVCGFCLENKLYCKSELVKDELPLINFKDLKKNYPPTSYDLFIAVGNNEIRKKIFSAAQKQGYFLASYISTKAKVWDNLIYGENVFIDEGTMLQPYVVIGDSSILFACNIGHHTKINNNCIISVVTTGGNVEIGANTYIGMNSAIKQNIKVGENNIIGMGCIIEKNTPKNSVYSNKGTRKRDISSKKISDRFLK